MKRKSLRSFSHPAHRDEHQHAASGWEKSVTFVLRLSFPNVSMGNLDEGLNKIPTKSPWE
jgi:hypothetical protein